jgi:hypothetical protein
MSTVISKTTTITKNKSAKTSISNPSVITPKMPIKSPKKVKKAGFNIQQFLLDNHSESLVYKIDIPSNSSWHLVLANSNLAHLSAMLFLVDSNNVVLYIGQTNHIYHYVCSLANSFQYMNPTTVYVVAHENASKYVHAVTAYRAKFKPTFNRETNVRFMFNPVKAVLNVTSTNVSSIDWIKSNPNATYSMFISKFSVGEMRKLCRLHCVGKYSYTALKKVILNNK